MFQLIFHDTSASDNEEGTEIKLRINTTIPSHNVSHILNTKKPSNWYDELIKEMELQFGGHIPARNDLRGRHDGAHPPKASHG
ncbi:hypothetical protein [Bdellovibrio sp. KM01]|uniref:hypothetical protein n=1 Tax=Bdellovibrio sp. KM01 TaxID=2748865 RepID=UPI0015EA4F07|nr:hypothetical protein [Bdellovibrio sp. KM01]QLY24264.1 hypothetical protein HW988_12405 [Bdellovibrio sp. KM01]